MKLIKLLLAIGLASAMTTASAQMYAEVAYGHATIDFGATGDTSVGTLGASIGYEAHKNLAIEASYSGTISKGSIRGIDIDFDRSYAFYFKPKFEIANNLELFAKLGWTDSKMTVSRNGQSASSTGDDFSYGVGAQYSFDKKLYVTGGYTVLYDKNNLKADMINIGAGYKF